MGFVFYFIAKLSPLSILIFFIPEFPREYGSFKIHVPSKNYRAIKHYQST